MPISGMLQISVKIFEHIKHFFQSNFKFILFQVFKCYLNAVATFDTHVDREVGFFPVISEKSPRFS